jgi:hypothetical protein
MRYVSSLFVGGCLLAIAMVAISGAANKDGADVNPVFARLVKGQKVEIAYINNGILIRAFEGEVPKVNHEAVIVNVGNDHLILRLKRGVHLTGAERRIPASSICSVDYEFKEQQE